MGFSNGHPANHFGSFPNYKTTFREPLGRGQLPTGNGAPDHAPEGTPAAVEMQRYSTAMVTVLEVTPPMVSTTGTASPVGAFAGT